MCVSLAVQVAVLELFMFMTILYEETRQLLFGYQLLWSFQIPVVTRSFWCQAVRDPEDRSRVVLVMRAGERIDRIVGNEWEWVQTQFKGSAEVKSIYSWVVLLISFSLVPWFPKCRALSVVFLSLYNLQLKFLRTSFEQYPQPETPRHFLTGPWGLCYEGIMMKGRFIRTERFASTTALILLCDHKQAVVEEIVHHWNFRDSQPRTIRLMIHPLPLLIIT